MRLFTALVILICIALLCVYSGVEHPRVALSACLASPEEYDGTVIYSPNEATVGELFDGGFTIRCEGKEVPVLGSNPRLKTGRYVQVRGIFRRGGYIEAHAVRVGSYRRWKMALSLIAVVIVFILLWRDFRWNKREATFERRMSDSGGGKGDNPAAK